MRLYSTINKPVNNAVAQTARAKSLYEHVVAFGSNAILEFSIVPFVVIETHYTIFKKSALKVVLPYPGLP